MFVIEPLKMRNAPLTVSLTPAGATVFPYINLGPKQVQVGNKTVTVGNPAGRLLVEQAIAYPAQPDPAASTEPDSVSSSLMTSPGTSASSPA